MDTVEKLETIIARKKEIENDKAGEEFINISGVDILKKHEKEYHVLLTMENMMKKTLDTFLTALNFNKQQTEKVDKSEELTEEINSPSKDVESHENNNTGMDKTKELESIAKRKKEIENDQKGEEFISFRDKNILKKYEEEYRTLTFMENMIKNVPAPFFNLNSYNQYKNKTSLGAKPITKEAPKIEEPVKIEEQQPEELIEDYKKNAELKELEDELQKVQREISEIKGNIHSNRELIVIAAGDPVPISKSERYKLLKKREANLLAELLNITKENQTSTSQSTKKEETSTKPPKPNDTPPVKPPKPNDTPSKSPEPPKAPEPPKPDDLSEINEFGKLELQKIEKRQKEIEEDAKIVLFGQQRTWVNGVRIKEIDYPEYQALCDMATMIKNTKGNVDPKVYSDLKNKTTYALKEPETIDPKEEKIELLKVKARKVWDFTKKHKKQVLMALGVTALASAAIVMTNDLINAAQNAEKLNQIGNALDQLKRNVDLMENATPLNQQILHGGNTVIAKSLQSLTGTKASFINGSWKFGIYDLNGFASKIAGATEEAYAAVSRQSNVGATIVTGGIGALGLAALKPRIRKFNPSREYRDLKSNITDFKRNARKLNEEQIIRFRADLESRILTNTSLTFEEKNILQKKLDNATKKVSQNIDFFQHEIENESSSKRL